VGAGRLLYTQEPLPQWIVGAVVTGLGDFNELMVRLPFAAFGVLVILLEATLTTQLFGRQIGRWCGLIQATCVYQMAHARLAESDIILQALVLAAMALFVREEWKQEERTVRPHPVARLGFWTLLGLMNLLKGVGFGALLTIVTCAGWMVLRGEPRKLRLWWSWPGVLVALVIGLGWPVAVLLYEPNGLAIWHSQIIGRATGASDHHQPVWYYLVHWPVQLLPWTPFVFVGAGESWKTARRDSRSADRLLWWWALSHPALLTLSDGKHHHYLIYALPALTPIIVRGLFQSVDAMTRLSAAMRLRSAWTAAGLGIAASFALFLLKPTRWWTMSDSVAFVGLAAFFAATITAMFVIRRPCLGLPVLLTGVIAGHLYAQAVVLPRRDPSANDIRFLEEVERAVPVQAPLVAFGRQEVSRHVFYLRRPVTGVSQVDSLSPLIQDSRELFVIARGKAADELRLTGEVAQVLQSRSTRRESSPLDRYTLFRVTRRELQAAGHSEQATR
jgi:4-amino-4-deoxy-L-arabinose transferase-like glycosyltransferase